jgi:hypothetical protein
VREFESRSVYLFTHRFQSRELYQVGEFRLDVYSVY